MWVREKLCLPLTHLEDGQLKYHVQHHRYSILASRDDIRHKIDINDIYNVKFLFVFALPYVIGNLVTPNDGGYSGKYVPTYYELYRNLLQGIKCGHGRIFG